MKKIVALSTILTAVLSSCGSNNQDNPTKAQTVSLQEAASEIIQHTNPDANAVIYLLDSSDGAAYLIKTPAEKTANGRITASSLSEISVVPTNDFKFTQTVSQSSMKTQALGTCKPEDGPYYRNRILGATQYSTAVDLSNDVVLSNPTASAFIYSGFTNSSDGTAYEVGWMQTYDDSKNSSQPWQLYIRAAGPGGSTFGPGTSGVWKNGWQGVSARFVGDTSFSVQSQIFTGSDGLNYITSTVVSPKQTYIIGVRTDNIKNGQHIDISSLSTSNANSIEARKIVSLADANATAHDGKPAQAIVWGKNDHIKLAKYRQARAWKFGASVGWPSSACAGNTQNMHIVFDSSSPADGDTVSIIHD